MDSLADLDLLVYDFEVFAHDWLVVFKHVGDKRREWFWNEDAEALREWMREMSDSFFVSFNGSHYDQYIMKAIFAGCSPEQVKEVNDWIISGEQGWQHPYLERCYFRFNDVDLMKDTQQGTSLKSVEGHLGLSVEESEVDFTHEGRLTAAERADVLHYCMHDVDATEALLGLRRGYLETKLTLGERAGLSPGRALYLTNAKLTAAVLGATRAEHDDERAYTIPGNLLREWIPDEVFGFFANMADPSVPDEVLWKLKLAIDVGGCPVTLAFGGIHGALPRYREERRDGRLIINIDVSSYYPSLMICNGYTSRNMRSPAVFEGIYTERLAAKKAGDKATANGLKLVVNTTYGATLNRYNDLYDPLMARSVCVSGQLYLLELAEHLVHDIEGLTLIQLNTDGIMVSLDESSYGKFAEIYHEWERRTGFGLEEDQVQMVWEKDVNNYAIRMVDGHEKVKGGYLVRGPSTVGAFSINNNATAVADALKAYLLDGTPINRSIDSCDDPAAFQLIAKAGGKYSRVYQLVDGEEVPMQKCNRVFATRDGRLGRLYKVKKADGSVAKIESLPEHCLVSNGGMPDIGDIDKDFYKRLALKRAADFEPEEGTMATAKAPDYTSMNVYQKLAIARRMFVEAGVKKSGINDYVGFDYFELDDIVPTQTRIFAEVGLVERTTKVMRRTVSGISLQNGDIQGVHEEPAKIVTEVINVDAPEEKISFELDWPSINPILNKDGKDTGNPLQRLGSEETYLRRYMKMLVLDLAEGDETDASIGGPRDAKTPAKSAVKSTTEVATADKGDPAPKKPAAKKTVKAKRGSAKPAEGADRAKTAAKLADPDGKATRLQVAALKKSIKTLKEEYPDNGQVAKAVAEIGVETENLKKEITKAECEKYINELGELKASIEKGE